MIRCKCGYWLSLVRVGKHESDIRCLRCGYSMNAVLKAARIQKKEV